MAHQQAQAQAPASTNTQMYDGGGGNYFSLFASEPSVLKFSIGSNNRL